MWEFVARVSSRLFLFGGSWVFVDIHLVTDSLGQRDTNVRGFRVYLRLTYLAKRTCVFNK
jgi:hypothetical protein